MTLSEIDFKRLSEFVHRTAGIMLPEAKCIMVEARLRKRVEDTGMPSFHTYCNFVLHRDGESEITPLLDRISTLWPWCRVITPPRKPSGVFGLESLRRTSRRTS